MTLCHLSHPMYLLGYVPKEDRAFLVDKTYNVHSYKLLLSMLSYQSAVVRFQCIVVLWFVIAASSFFFLVLPSVSKVLIHRYYWYP